MDFNPVYFQMIIDRNYQTAASIDITRLYQVGSFRINLNYHIRCLNLEMKAGLTFACMNLKKLAKILELRGKIKSSISYIFKNESKYWLYNEKWCWE